MFKYNYREHVPVMQRNLDSEGYGSGTRLMPFFSMITSKMRYHLPLNMLRAAMGDF